MKKFTIPFFVIVLFFLPLFSLFAADDKNATSISIGVLNASMNGIPSYSTTLINSLKTYAPTLRVDTDDERVYVNLLPLRKNVNTAYKNFRSSLSSSNRTQADEKKQEFDESMRILQNSQEHFRYSSSLQEPIEDVIVAPVELYTNSNMFLDDVSINYSTFDLTKFDPTALFDESKVVAHIISEENNFDLIIMPECTAISTTLFRLRLKVFNYIEDKYDTLFDEIVSSFEFQDKLDSFVLLLAKYLSDRDYVSFTVAAKDYSISVTIDREHLNAEKGIVLEGTHTVVFSSPGRITRRETIEFKKGEPMVLDIDLEKHHYQNLELTTQSGKGVAEVQGVKFPLPHVFDEYETPFDFTINEVGFLPFTGAIMQGRDDYRLRVSMRPEWTADETLLHNTEVKFYSMITATLGLFTTTILLRSFNRNQYNNTNAILSSTNDIVMGAAYTSIGFILGFLIDYFLISKYNLY